jgi:toxin FitB
VTVGELAQWTKLRHWGPGNLAMPSSWLAGKLVIPGGKAIAAVWAVCQPRPSRAASPGHRHLGCCLLPCYQLPLVTFDLRDFKDFAGYHGLPLLEP